jgi:DNA-binding MarR family transcriptional regulator
MSELASETSAPSELASESSAPTDREHTANLLGALALVITDRVADAVSDVGPSATAAAALSALHQFLDTPTIDRLAQVLGLSHSGTVRLVDRLERDGHVRRRPGQDARSTALTLTASGRRLAGRISGARGRVLAEALDTLTDAERATLDALAARLLVGLMRGPGATRWMCRMCDLAACGRSAGHCPVEREAVARYGGKPRQGK